MATATNLLRPKYCARFVSQCITSDLTISLRGTVQLNSLLSEKTLLRHIFWLIMLNVTGPTLNVSHPCPRTEFTCSVQISEQRLCSHTSLIRIFMLYTNSVHCAVQTESLYIIRVTFRIYRWAAKCGTLLHTSVHSHASHQNGKCTKPGTFKEQCSFENRIAMNRKVLMLPSFIMRSCWRTEKKRVITTVKVPLLNQRNMTPMLHPIIHLSDASMMTSWLVPADITRGDEVFLREYKRGFRATRRYRSYIHSDSW